MSHIDEKVAWMNIDGKDTRLTLVSSTTRETSLRLGGRSTRIYKAGDVAVRFDLKTTQVCPPNALECSGVGYEGTINVSKGNRKQAVIVTGGCGC